MLAFTFASSILNNLSASDFFIVLPNMSVTTSSPLVFITFPTDFTTFGTVFFVTPLTIPAPK